MGVTLYILVYRAEQRRNDVEKIDVHKRALVVSGLGFGKYEQATHPLTLVAFNLLINNSIQFIERSFDLFIPSANPFSKAPA